MSYENNVYTLTTPQAQARVLLPTGLPLEERAVAQLLSFASVRSADGAQGVCAACATPDFHPGSIAPVGTIVATPADFVIPASIGTDINCGMRLVRTGLTRRAFDAREQALLPGLSKALLEGTRDLPLPGRAFKALFDEGPLAVVDLLPHQGLWAQVDRDRMACEVAACISLASFGGASRYAPDYLLEREVIRDPGLGTMGAGNHFVEFMQVEELLDRRRAYETGLRLGEVVFMIHSGSRVVGHYVGNRWIDEARNVWPAAVAHPKHKLYGLSGAIAREYLQAIGGASRYAWLNRVALTEMVRAELARAYGQDATAVVVDVPHNVVLQEDGFNIHRKGATPAHAGELALIPGSMGTSSYLVAGLGNPDWLASCSHGAGRAVRRQSMRCITLREERRIEEAPSAYKPIGPVIDAQEKAGLFTTVARFSPLLTFKA